MYLCTSVFPAAELAHASETAQPSSVGTRFNQVRCVHARTFSATLMIQVLEGLCYDTVETKCNIT